MCLKHTDMVFKKILNLKFIIAGTEVYEANTFSALGDLGWDGNNGEEQPDGVYIWILNATDLNGQINPKEELMKGTLLLNR